MPPKKKDPDIGRRCTVYTEYYPNGVVGTYLGEQIRLSEWFYVFETAPGEQFLVPCESHINIFIEGIPRNKTAKLLAMPPENSEVI